MQIHALGMENAKQKQRGIVGSGGKLINHGDTEITERATSKGLTRRRGGRGDASQHRIF